MQCWRLSRNGGLPSSLPSLTLFLALFLAFFSAPFSPPSLLSHLSPLQPALAFQAAVDIGVGQKRCMGEQLSKHVLIVGEFRIIHPSPSHPSGSNGPMLMHVMATDSSSNSSNNANSDSNYANSKEAPLFQQSSRDHIRTAFTSVRPGVHLFCIKNISKQQLTVEVQILWGPAARDYSQLAKAEHLDDVMVKLLQLQDKLKLHHSNVLYLREREQVMRQESESTASRLIMFCGFNIFLLISSSVVSAYFFKRFFRSKKII